MKQGITPTSDNPARLDAVSSHYATRYQPELANYLIDNNFSTKHCMAILSCIINCRFDLPPGHLATVTAPAAPTTPPPTAPARAVPAPALPTDSQTAQALAEGVLAAYRLNAGAPALARPGQIPQHAPQADTNQTAKSLATNILAAYRESQEGQTP